MKCCEQPLAEIASRRFRILQFFCAIIDWDVAAPTLDEISLSRLYGFFTSTTMLLLMIRYGGAGAGFLTHLVLARLLAPESLGLFFAATSLVAVASTIAAFGYPEIAPRFVSRYQARGRMDILSGFVRHSRRDILFFSTAAAGLIIACALIWPGASREERAVFIVAALWLPILGYLDINSWIALSLRSFFLAYGPENFLGPVIILVIVATLYILGVNANVLVLLIAYMAVSSMLTFAQWWLLRPLLPHGDTAHARPVDPRIVARWRREGAPQIAVGIYTMMFADLAILLTAILLPAAELAAFAIALKLAILVGFAMQVAHQLIIPDLADAHAERRFGQTRDTMRAAATLPVVITIGALIGAIMFGDWVLAIFHPDFAKAQNVLVLLIGCQLLRALAGPVVQLLTVAGAQLVNAGLCIGATLVLAIANLLLVPAFGMLGAACAIFVTWSAWLVASAIALSRLTGLRCDILAVTGLAGRLQGAR